PRFDTGAPIIPGRTPGTYWARRLSPVQTCRLDPYRRLVGTRHRTAGGSITSLGCRTTAATTLRFAAYSTRPDRHAGRIHDEYRLHGDSGTRVRRCRLTRPG